MKLWTSVARLWICQLHARRRWRSLSLLCGPQQSVCFSYFKPAGRSKGICWEVFNVAVMCSEFTMCVSDVQSMLPKYQWLAVLRDQRDTIQGNMLHLLVAKTLQVRTPCSNWFLTAKPVPKYAWWCLFPIAEQYTVEGILLVIARCLRRSLPAVVDTYNVAHNANVSQLQWLSNDPVITHHWPYNTFANSRPTQIAAVMTTSSQLYCERFVHSKIYWCNGCKGHIVTVRIYSLFLHAPSMQWSRIYQNRQSCDEDTYHVLSNSSWRTDQIDFTLILALFPGSPHVWIKNWKESGGYNCWKTIA